jgi:hypothetical protein
MSPSLLSSHKFIKSHLQKLCIHGCLVNTGEKIDFFEQKGGSNKKKWSIRLNLLSRGLTLPPLKLL